MSSSLGDLTLSNANPGLREPRSHGLSEGSALLLFLEAKAQTAKAALKGIQETAKALAQAL